MISLEYAEKILNLLFHTGGKASDTLDAEAEMLQSEGISISTEITAADYFDAFERGGYRKDNNEYIAELDKKAQIVNQTECYCTEATALEVFEYSKGMSTVSFSGWRVKERDEQLAYYPNSSFLALFTTMPDERGNNYVEPAKNGDGESTTYMRVNLHEGVITGDKTLNRAAADVDTGKIVVSNKEIIAYPEVFGVDWGKIVGFGVFAEESIGKGSPIFWGRLNNEIEAKTEHVPLFRIGDFQITLQ